jgi:hypothetical protein
MFVIDLRTATFASYIIKWQIFIAVVESVYSAEQTNSVYKTY